MTKLAKTNLIRQKYVRQWAWPVSIMYLLENFNKSSFLKPVVRIENNSAEMVIR